MRMLDRLRPPIGWAGARMLGIKLRVCGNRTDWESLDWTKVRGS